MAIKRFLSIKDNTITNTYKSDLKTRATNSNLGASDVAEVFSIYGQASTSSVEKSRILMQFPVNEINSLIKDGKIPETGVTYKLKLFNSTHSYTTPENFTLSVSPVLQSWNEGSGLDMEGYRDLGNSNWISCSSGVLWFDQGATMPLKQNLEADSPTPPVELVQDFKAGTENLEVDITSYISSWRKILNSTGTKASGSVQFNSNPNQNEKLKIIKHDGDHRVIQFLAAGSSSLGNTSSEASKTIYVTLGGTPEATAINFAQVVGDHSDLTTQRSTNTVTITQATESAFGNTVMSASADLKTRISLTDFTGGSGLPNNGLIIKLSGSFESGANSRSYYTKKFFTRTSEFFFKRPIIEAQWDSAKLDDRPNIFKSSDLIPADQNLHNIFLYNYGPFGLTDIPNTGSNLVVQLYSALAFTGSHQPHLAAETLPVAGGVLSTARTFITASKVETGIYSATFAYDGTASKLYDVWSVDKNLAANAPPTQIYTGSVLTVNERKSNDYYEIPSFVTKIVNLKQKYTKNEKAKFRLYTRNKNWNPNVYTKATSKAPVDTLKQCYYKISRAVDNLTIINYSTASLPEYSKLSYDSSGSYFDLDMSILEPNYLYEISLLFKQGDIFVEQGEKFRFRVDS
tara:strand:- start:42266 stop:44152 length:1887 start_codon:yes stop_codon:yes gene_type:complete